MGLGKILSPLVGAYYIILCNGFFGQQIVSWTNDQVSAVLEKHYADHPEQRHFDASSTLLAALVDACPNAP